MNTPANPNPEPSPKDTEQSTLDEARVLFDRMAGEAVRQSEAEQQRAKSRSPLLRALLVLTLAAAFVVAVTMFYGAYYFPDAPIRATAQGYAGKGGTVRTQQDFESFVSWKRTLLVAFVMVLVLSVSFGITDAMKSRS